jgi:hypothetical protein
MCRMIIQLEFATVLSFQDERATIVSPAGLQYNNKKQLYEKECPIMQNFEFYTPTKVYFGRDTHKQIGEIIQSYGFKKVLIHFGGGSVKKRKAVCWSVWKPP